MFTRNFSAVFGRPRPLLCRFSCDATADVVYFPGDVQSMREEMLESDTSRDYVEYCFENMIELLASKFAPCNVFLVKPVRYDGSFNHYDDLIMPGIAVVNLKAMMEDARTQFSTSEGGFPTRNDLPVKLIAFSKGAVAINHLLAELATVCANDPSGLVLDWEVENKQGRWSLPTWEPSMRISRTASRNSFLLAHKSDVIDFFSHVEQLHWVDCHRFPTNPVVVSAITTSFPSLIKPLGVFLHSTPRQMKDRSRKWIAAEHNEFVAQVQTHNDPANLKLHVKEYLSNEPPSMENHFAVLKLFC
ncbi:hypothetical protein Pelo_8954 [Pelomyxa schiedti]|nr:hypothetical protein Pelo_8954 [Pelomyxa schiedti]